MKEIGTVAVIFGEVPPGARDDEKDVLVEVDAVTGVLRSRGIAAVPVPVTLDMAVMLDRIRACRADLVFNLVESINGIDRLNVIAPLVLETGPAPFTGGGATAMCVTSNKVLTKSVLRHHGIPTPWWQAQVPVYDLPPGMEFPCIVKPVDSEASRCIDDQAVCRSRPELERRIGQMNAGGESWYIERFVDGREFNISVMETARGPAVLPPAEVLFNDFPAGKPAIVGYRAKWAPESFEYVHTPRTFDFPASDNGLLDRLGELSLGCWNAFGLQGYARVDFRVDAYGEPTVLEINLNPCISPDAGFPAAAQRAGYAYDAMVMTIIDTAYNRNRTLYAADNRSS